jgi:hypothetical protein
MISSPALFDGGVIHPAWEIATATPRRNVAAD